MKMYVWGTQIKRYCLDILAIKLPTAFPGAIAYMWRY